MVEFLFGSVAIEVVSGAVLFFICTWCGFEGGRIWERTSPRRLREGRSDDRYDFS